MEISKSVDQQTKLRRQRVLAFIEVHAAALAHQGTVVASFRRRGGQIVGPYYRLAFRQNQVQRSSYLSNDMELVAEVRTALANLQKPGRDRRVFLRQKRVVRKALAQCKAEWKRALARRGLRLQGYEVRGWHCPGPRAAAAKGGCGGQESSQGSLHATVKESQGIAALKQDVESMTR